jgi:single-stranded DNA-binding protein
MNRFIGVGRLPRNAVVVGSEKKVLRFTLATPNGHGKKGTYWAYVPCVVFKPSDELVSLLTQDGKGTLLAIEGRVNTSRFESKGQIRYSTEVIVDERSIHTTDDYANTRSPGSSTAVDPELERLMVTPPEDSDSQSAGSTIE